VTAEDAATAELARMCGLLPLALRIAAANLLDQPGRGIADYLAELTETSRLAGLAVDDDPEAAVRAAFDTSYAVMEPDDRRMFRLLGLVPGPEVTAPAAAALAAVPLRRAAQLLDRLAGAHLLEPRAPGRGLHDLLRHYARQRTQQEDEAKARQAALGRLLDWYLQVADAAARLLYPEKTRLPLPPLEIQPPQVSFADRAHALAWLDAERSNLVAAVQYAAAHGPRPAAWLIADTLRGYFVLGRFPAEWLAVARAGLAAAEADDQPRAQAAAYLSLADLGVAQSRYEQATRDYLRALPLARRSGWLHGEAAALGSLGMVYQQSGRLQEASQHHARALALDGQTGCLAGQAVNLGNLGLVSWLMGRLEQAADYDLRALAGAGPLPGDRVQLRGGAHAQQPRHGLPRARAIRRRPRAPHPGAGPAAGGR
jgi:tetratricopeptide (TPR) repeat protein